MSSNAALQRVRRLLGGCKAGHAGSLDPLATGMLPLCLGEATKIAGEILSSRKRYRFTIALGVATATGDREGPVIEEAPVPPRWQEGLQAALRGFHGPGRQVPPMYSALKRDGQPLYRLARAGRDRGARAAGDRDLRAGAGVADGDGGGARGALLQGHLRAHPGGGHRARAGYAAGTSRHCGAVGSSPSRKSGCRPSRR